MDALNDEPTAGNRGLHDGDRIQLGNILLRFQAQVRLGSVRFAARQGERGA